MSKDIEFPRDQPRLSWGELERKFHSLAGALLPTAQVEHAIATIGKLDTLDNVGTLAQVLSVGAQTPQR